MSEIQFPPCLPPGGTIGVVAPSRWPQPAWLDAAVALIEGRGYKAYVHPQTALMDGRLGGTDEARAAALMDVFTDKKIDAILCARGGAGAIRMVDKLDYGLIAQNPKPFIGFSDATVLLQAIARRAGFVTFHGPMGWNFGQADNDPRTVDDFFAMIAEGRRTIDFPDVDVVRQGDAHGPLWGGNMSLLQTLIGTPYDWPGEGSVLFMEDVEEHLYRLDRTLNHMRLAGKFKAPAAFLLGEMVSITDADEDDPLPYGKSLEALVLEKLPSSIPVVMNVPFGHGAYTTTLPVGAMISVAATSKSLSLRFGS